MKEIRFSRVAVIAGHAALAESVCRHFRKHRTYLPLFEAIRPRMDSWGTADTDYIHICNAVSFSEPDCILLVGCDSDRLRLIYKHISPKPGTEVIEIQDYEPDALSGLPGFRDIEKAHECRELSGPAAAGGHVIAVEESSSLATVLARNLAVAEGADLLTIPGVNRDEVDAFWDQQRLWMNGDAPVRQDAWNWMKHFIEERLGSLCDAHLDSLSFMTLGIPYGLWPFQCPTMHRT